MKTFAEYAAMMVGAEHMMSREQRTELEEFEQARCNPSSALFLLGTSDWPGWLALIGPPPNPPVRPAAAPVSKTLRRQVYDRDGWACRHCGTAEDLSIDHVIPIVRGGQTTLENLQTLCRPCNTKKGANLPV